jgi:hypothetical protein
MAAVEVIYLLAASLWIGVVVAALCIGIRLMMKFRAKRRRMNRILDAVRFPLRLCTLRGSASVGQLLSGFVAEAVDPSRKKGPRGSRRPTARLQSRK